MRRENKRATCGEKSMLCSLNYSCDDTPSIRSRGFDAKNKPKVRRRNQGGSRALDSVSSASFSCKASFQSINSLQLTIAGISNNEPAAVRGPVLGDLVQRKLFFARVGRHGRFCVADRRARQMIPNLNYHIDDAARRHYAPSQASSSPLLLPLVSAGTDMRSAGHAMKAKRQNPKRLVEQVK